MTPHHTDYRLYFIMGPAGSGKTTVLQNVIHTLPRIRYIPSYTTRPLRPGEIDGQKYHFVDNTWFEECIQTGKRIEYAKTRKQDYRYGTSKKDVTDAFLQGYDVIKEIDILGLQQVLQTAFAKSVISIFLSVEASVLYTRLLGRGDLDEKTIDNFIDVAQEELEGARIYCTHIIDGNQSQAQVAQEVRSYIMQKDH